MTLQQTLQALTNACNNLHPDFSDENADNLAKQAWKIYDKLKVAVIKD